MNLSLATVDSEAVRSAESSLLADAHPVIARRKCEYRLRDHVERRTERLVAGFWQHLDDEWSAAATELDPA
jgi:hypothetical protein